MITVKTMTKIQPVELNYNFYNNESLVKSTDGFEEGYNFNFVDGLNNFQDITINKNTCFVLTSSIILSSIFVKQQQSLKLGQIPTTINLQTRNSIIYYLGYSFEKDAVVSTYLTPQNFYISPVNDKEVEIKVGNFYLEVDDTYPYKIRANNLTLTPDEIHRRRFKFSVENDQISLIAQTKDGDRFLALGNDNILRATGVMLGNNIANDYIFKVQKVTQNNINYNFTPSNSWVTYFLDFPNQTNNTNILVNKEYDNINTNFLISFPVSKATNNVNINVANLKTGYTPTGSPTTMNNTYEEQIVTSN